MAKKTIYDKLTKKYQNELLESLAKFVEIASVKDPASISKKNPYGKKVSKALEFFYQLAKNDGFKVTNYDNRVIEVLCGNGKKNITIMAHADVVPAGNDWKTDPFQMVESKGVLYGRGVADDKGPLLAAYYALKCLRDTKRLGDYTVRFLVGGDEECGSSCMEYYFQTLKKPMPDLGFSPDSAFPCVFAEKAFMTFSISKKINIKGFVSLNGGVAANSVIDKAILSMDVDASFIKFICDNYSRKQAELYTHDDITEVIFHGVSAHGSVPELGFNAGVNALGALASYSQDADLLAIYKKLLPLDGKGYKCANTSKAMGHNSSNVGVIYTDEKKNLNIVVNFRHVESVTTEAINKKLANEFSKYKYKLLSVSPLLFYPTDSNLVQAIYNSYVDETGDFKSQPISTGGGTYAKEAKNVIAAGMEFPGVDSHMHSAGECLKKEHLFKGMAIYTRMILNLGEKLKNEN